MKLVVSNIAWTNEEESSAAELLKGLGVKYVEIAPTKKWQDPTTQAKGENLKAYQDFWGQNSLEVVAFQSMLFNRPDLKIFENKELRRQTLDYLKRFIELASKLGVGVMVFGSPKNRQRGDISDDEALAIAKDFFSEIGDYASANNTCFCIEPNPKDYGCDFITDARQGIEFVRSVGNPGLGLHLDIAGMTLAGDDVPQSIKDASEFLRHFHISAPFLDQVEDRSDVAYREAAQALKGINYQGFVSIEMKPAAEGENLARVEKAVKFCQTVFAN